MPSLLDGGTSTTAGGAAQTFTRTSAVVTHGYEYADVSEADFFARQKLILTSRMPALQPDGTYSKQKSARSFVMPITRADGTIAYNVVRNIIEYDPESSAAQVAELREMGAQMSVRSEFDDQITAGTLP